MVDRGIDREGIRMSEQDQTPKIERAAIKTVLDHFARAGMPWVAWLFLLLLVVFIIVAFASAGMKSPNGNQLFQTANEAIKVVFGALVGSLSGHVLAPPSN